MLIAIMKKPQMRSSMKVLVDLGIGSVVNIAVSSLYVSGIDLLDLPVCGVVLCHYNDYLDTNPDKPMLRYFGGNGWWKDSNLGLFVMAQMGSLTDNRIGSLIRSVLSLLL